MTMVIDYTYNVTISIVQYKSPVGAIICLLCDHDKYAQEKWTLHAPSTKAIKHPVSNRDINNIEKGDV